MKKNLSLLLLLVLTACASVAPASPTVTSTLPPTNTPIPTPTITPTTTPVPDGPCDSPLLPLNTGNEWTYRATTEGGESLYTLKTLERDDARNIVIKVEFTDLKNNVTVLEPVVCMDGAIENFPLFVANMHLTDFIEGNFNTYHDTGIYSPSYQTLADNNWSMSWDATYQAEDGISLINPMGGSALLMGQNAPITLSFETDGTREAVTVGAGSYPQAVKVLHTFAVQVAIFQGSSVTTGDLIVNTTQWIEPYVGLLRAEVDSAFVHLFGSSSRDIPVTIVNRIELIEFEKGK